MVHEVGLFTSEVSVIMLTNGAIISLPDGEAFFPLLARLDVCIVPGQPLVEFLGFLSSFSFKARGSILSNWLAGTFSIFPLSLIHI